MVRFARALSFVATLAALAPAAFAQTRLEVGFIAREPRIPPPTSAQAPREEGWPDAGSRVHWVAHVLNRGTAAVAAVPYTWRIDDETVESGTVDLPPGESTVWLPWRWTFDRHAITFALHPPAGDTAARDDQLTVASDALSIGFWVEQGLYDWMAQGGRPGFEPWAQGQIETWNGILARAVFPTTPSGALDRLRLDRILVLPNGRRPQNGEMDTDVMWAFLNESNDERFLHVGAPSSVLADSTIVLHELLHLRGLIDLYAYTVVHGDAARTDSRIDIQDNGRPIVTTPLMPAILQGADGTIVYRTPFDGLMGTRYTARGNLTEHCANGLNLRAGHRTPLWLDQWGNQINGYSNALLPDSYVRRLPRRTELRVVNEQGQPIVGATVEVYLDHSDWTYQKRYLAGPDRTGTADERGVVVLPGDLLDVVAANQLPKADVIIVGVKTATARGYAFLPVYDLNMLYFRQGAERGEMDLEVKLVAR